MTTAYGTRSYGGGARTLTSVSELPSQYPPYTPVARLTDPLRAEILADTPFAYYPLDDAAAPVVDANWTPTQISGCVAWLNPDTLPGADGDSISSAPAVGANPAWFQVGASGPPTIQRNGLNGRSYIRISAFRGLAIDVNLTGASTVFLVARLRGTRSGRVLAGYRNNWLLGWHGTKEDQYHGVGWWYGDDVGNPVGPPVTTELRQYAGVFTNAGGNDGIFYRNGVKLHESSGGSAGPHGLALAGFQIATNGSSEGQWSDSDVYEVIAYNRVLTDREMALVHDHLSRHNTFVGQSIQSTGRRDASGNGRAAESVNVVSKGERPLVPRGFAARFSTSALNVIQTPFTTQWPEFTVEVLVQPEGAAASSEIISKRSYFATTNTDFPFAVTHGSDGKFSVVLDNGGDFSASGGINGATVFARNQMHHVVVVVRNNGLCELYVNGVLDGSTTIAFALATNTRAWTLGGPAFENGGGVNLLRYNGKAQHWAIYDKALTPVRIAAHYAAARPTRAVTVYTRGYKDVVLSQSPVSYWRLGEASGSVAADETSHRAGTYNAVTLGTAGLLVGDPDTAATFNGATGTRVQMANSSDLNLTSGTGTLSLWFRTAGAGSGHRGMAMRHFYYGLFLYDNILEIFDWSGGGRRSTGISCADNLPHHAAVTFQTGITNGTKIYLDGVLVLTTTIGGYDTVNGSSTGGFVIGAGNNEGSGQTFAGVLDEVAVFPTILSADDIALQNSTGRSTPQTTRADVAPFLAS